jgi:hypothetical protein
MLRKLTRLLLVLVAGTALTSARAELINIDSQSTDGVVLNLAAGRYDFNFIGTADGGQYDAWTAWPLDCVLGPSCQRGYINELRIEGLAPSQAPAGAIVDQGLTLIGDHFNPIWPTMAEALQSAMAHHAFTLVLQNAAELRFLVGEGPNCPRETTTACWTDNRGGLSLKVAAVPEPQTYAMLLLGLPLALAMARRRRPSGPARGANAG